MFEGAPDGNGKGLFTKVTVKYMSAEKYMSVENR